jgi:hypothetical protein
MIPILDVTKQGRKGKEQVKTKNKWAYRKLPTYMT